MSVSSTSFDRPITRIRSTTAGIDLSIRRYVPTQKPVGAVTFVHGIGGHSGRYIDLARGMAARGFFSQTFDLRGHGLSDGRRCFVRRFEEYCDDLDLVIGSGLREHPGLLQSTFGISMGSVITLRHLTQRHFSLYRSAVWGVPRIQGPLITPFLSQKMRILFGAFLAPTLTVPLRSNPTLSSRRPPAPGAPMDPLVQTRATSALLWALHGAARALDRFPTTCKTPVLFLHGGKDQVAMEAGGKSIADAYPGPKSWSVYPEAYHDLPTDPDQEAVLDQLADWFR